MKFDLKNNLTTLMNKIFGSSFTEETTEVELHDTLATKLGEMNTNISAIADLQAQFAEFKSTTEQTNTDLATAIGRIGLLEEENTKLKSSLEEERTRVNTLQAQFSKELTGVKTKTKESTIDEPIKSEKKERGENEPKEVKFGNEWNPPVVKVTMGK